MLDPEPCGPLRGQARFLLPRAEQAGPPRASPGLPRRRGHRVSREMTTGALRASPGKAAPQQQASLTPATNQQDPDEARQQRPTPRPPASGAPPPAPRPGDAQASASCLPSGSVTAGTPGTVVLGDPPCPAPPCPLCLPLTAAGLPAAPQDLWPGLLLGGSPGAVHSWGPLSHLARVPG